MSKSSGAQTPGVVAPLSLKPCIHVFNSTIFVEMAQLQQSVDGMHIETLTLWGWLPKLRSNSSEVGHTVVVCCLHGGALNTPVSAPRRVCGSGGSNKRPEIDRGDCTAVDYSTEPLESSVSAHGALSV